MIATGRLRFAVVISSHLSAPLGVKFNTTSYSPILCIEDLWNELSIAFSRIVTANQDIDMTKRRSLDIEEHQGLGHSNVESYGKWYLRENFELERQHEILLGNWLPDCKQIPDYIYICVLAWLQRKELHSLLRQCPCCGMFKIVLRGKWIYCSEKCREMYTRKSREADNASKTTSREKKRQKAREEIINWLCDMKDSPYSRKDAEGIYEREAKLHPNNVASLETFQNTYGRRTYLI